VRARSKAMVLALCLALLLAVAPVTAYAVGPGVSGQKWRVSINSR